MGGGTVDKNASPTQKFLITGTTVVMEMASGGLFMENVKMEKQRTSQPYPTIMRNILKQGIRGFEAGLLPWGVVLGFTKGSVLGGAKAIFDQHFEETKGMDKRTAAYYSGPLSGAVQGVVMSPILLARTRVNQAVSEAAATGKTLTIGQQTGILNTLIKEEGMMGLTKGMPLFICKRAMDWGSRFVFLVWMRDWLKNQKGDEELTDIEKAVTAFSAGAASVAVTIPVDRMAPVIQAAGSEAKNGILPYIKNKIAQEGLGTMFRGSIMRTVHTGYHTVFAIFIADKISEMLRGGK